MSAFPSWPGYLAIGIREIRKRSRRATRQREFKGSK
jgi:hypothetical protein